MSWGLETVARAAVAAASAVMAVAAAGAVAVAVAAVAAVEAGAAVARAGLAAGVAVAAAAITLAQDHGVAVAVGALQGVEAAGVVVAAEAVAVAVAPARAHQTGARLDVSVCVLPCSKVERLQHACKLVHRLRDAAVRVGGHILAVGWDVKDSSRDVTGVLAVVGHDHVAFKAQHPGELARDACLHRRPPPKDSHRQGLDPALTSSLIDDSDTNIPAHKESV